MKTATLIFASVLAARMLNAQTEKDNPVFRETGDIYNYEIVPSVKGTFRGVPFTANRWGMRDKEYSLKPPPNTFRIALLGSSYTLGDGVRVEATTPWLVEERLNKEGPGAPKKHYEILNFSVGNYGILQYVAQADQKVFQFQPDEVIFVLHSLELYRLGTHLIRLTKKRAPIPYPFIQQQLALAGVKPDMQEVELRRRLKRVLPEIVKWGYERLAETCRAHNVRLVGLIFDAEGREGKDQAFAKLQSIAASAGIETITLAGSFGTTPVDSIHLADDFHLNPLGHKLVANRLYDLLRADSGRLLSRTQ